MAKRARAYSDGSSSRRNVRPRGYLTPPRTPFRVTGNIANPGRFARNLAETAFNRYAPLPLRAAVGVGRLAYSAYRRLNQRNMKKIKAPAAGKRYTQGSFGGRFKRPRRVKKDIYRKAGFMHTTEVHGSVNDPDCVYIGHSTFSATQLLEVILQSLLRKLFQKTNWVCHDVNENLPSFSDGNVSNLWRIKLIRQDKVAGTLFEHSFTTSVNTSIYLIVGDVSAGLAPQWPELIEYFRDFMRGDRTAGGSNFNTIEPYKLILYREEGNVSVFYQHEAELFMSECNVNVYSKSTMKIQNRTLSADAGNQSDDVSANPITGKQYVFSSGVPRPAGLSDLHVFQKMLDPSGVLSVRANQAGVGNAFKEPLPAQTFRNCSKSGTIVLQPGEIKYSNIYYKARKPLLSFLYNMGYALGTSNTANIHIIGKSAMFALEDVINVNAANNINIAYEVNREFGCYITLLKNFVAQGRRYDIEHNNVPVS